MGQLLLSGLLVSLQHVALEQIASNLVTQLAVQLHAIDSLLGQGLGCVEGRFDPLFCDVIMDESVTALAVWNLLTLKSY